jgi:hypothetical protein
MKPEFSGPLWHWKEPVPWYFVTVADALRADLRAASKLVSYGWGMLPVRVRIGSSGWETSLFPQEGRYLVPVRASVRQAEGLEQGDEVTVRPELR